MALYLQMDGVDDYLKLPSMTMKKFVIDAVFETQSSARALLDARDGLTNGYVVLNANGTLTMPGAVFAASNFVANQRTVATFTAINATYTDANGNFTDNVNIFSDKNGASPIKGKIYSVKCYDVWDNLVAHYDMSTGTVQDQSGNGNHATLTGGTWLDDGTGGGNTGTEGSISYSTKNIIYRTSSNSYSSKQQISQTSSQQHNTKQNIYSNQSQPFNTKIIQYKISSSDYQTKQLFTVEQGKEGTVTFSTKQQITLVRSDVFATRQELKGRFYKTLNLYTSNQSEIKLNTALGNVTIEIVAYKGQTVYQPNTLRSVTEMEVIT